MPSCQQPSCGVTAAFNYPGSSRGKYCNKHKADGMVNVISKKCANPSCKATPYYNYPWLNDKLFCRKHQTPGMVNLKKLCENLYCAKIAAFHYPGVMLPIFCEEHKYEGMVNVKSLRMSTREFNKRRQLVVESSIKRELPNNSERRKKGRLQKKIDLVLPPVVIDLT